MIYGERRKHSTKSSGDDVVSAVYGYSFSALTGFLASQLLIVMGRKSFIPSPGSGVSGVQGRSAI